MDILTLLSHLLLALFYAASVEGAALPAQPIDDASGLDGHHGNSSLSQNTVLATFLLGAALSWSHLDDGQRSRLRQPSFSHVKSGLKSVVVVRADFDQAEQVLSILDIPFTVISTDKLKDHLKYPCRQVLVLNSGVLLSRAQMKIVRRFTRRGGIVLASDSALVPLAKAFRGKRIKFRQFSTLDRRHPVRVEPTDLNANGVSTSSGSCAQARDVADAFREVMLRDLPAYWRLEETSIALKTGVNASRTYSLARSDDLRLPFDSIVTCFDHKRGHVFHVAGRFFQLQGVLGIENEMSRNEIRLNENQLRQLFVEVEEASPLHSDTKKALLRHPPTISQVVSARLSTGLLLQLLRFRLQSQCSRSV